MNRMQTKKVEKWTFDELADYVTRELFDGLISGGTKGMRTKWYVVFNVVGRWIEANGSSKS